MDHRLCGIGSPIRSGRAELGGVALGPTDRNGSRAWLGPAGSKTRPTRIPLCTYSVSTLGLRTGL